MEPIVHTFGGSAMDRYLFDFEAVADAAPADVGAADPGSASADAGDGGAAASPADVGAATSVADPAAPPSAPQIDWDSPDAQARINAALDAREQAATQAHADAQRQQEQASEFDDIKEAFEMLGIPADRFEAFLANRLGQQTAPFQQAAEKIQQQEQLAWVDSALGQLGTKHVDLLGEGVDKLSELVDDEGKSLFNPDEVRQHNREAVLYAAAGLQNALQLDHGQALTRGADAVAARDAIIGKVAVQQYIRRLETSGAAPTDISGGGATGAGRLTGIEGGDELTIARRWAAENLGRTA